MEKRLQTTTESGVTKFQVTSDSKITITMLHKLINGSRTKRVIKSWWLETIGEHICSSLPSFEYVITEHVDRECHKAIGKLVNWD